MQFILKKLSSLRVTLPLLILLAFSVVYYYKLGREELWFIIVPLLLLSVNLLAALIIHPRFKRNIPLTLFHLTLIGMVLLAALGRLTYLDGRLEVTTGSGFDGDLKDYDAGPFHTMDFDNAHFVLEEFTVDYGPGPMPVQNRTETVVRLDSGQRVYFGDHRPLLINGYRFYTSSNKGYAAIFIWKPEQGEPIGGSIHFPAYPTYMYRQTTEWRVPGTEVDLWSMLHFDEQILSTERMSQFRLPNDHLIIMRYKGERKIMKPGDSLQLPGGELQYQALTTWKGFAVKYDWTIPYMLALSLIAVGALAAHYWSKYNKRPWLAHEDEKFGS